MHTGKKFINIPSGKDVAITRDGISNILAKERISIKNTPETIDISINKDYLSTLKPNEVNKILLTALSPLFLSNNEIFNTKSLNGGSKSFKHIAFFIEQMPHYTGGRYSIYHQALLLSQYTKVTVVSNMKPPFYDDFKDYYNSNFELVVDFAYLTGAENNDKGFDLIIGCPVQGGLNAEAYANKFDLPLYMIMFESPNWVKKFRDGSDSYEEFWQGYKACLLRAQKIMVPSYESQKHIREWLKADPRIHHCDLDKDIHVVYPCINQVVADRIKEHRINIKHKNKKINIIYISRMIPAKSPLPLLKKLNKDLYCFHIIGKIWTDQMKEIEKLQKTGLEIHMHGKINDEEKFKLIAESDVLVFPTHFEGFGMPPMEALYFNKPVIAYDLPVLREIYGDSIHYVPVGDTEALVNKIAEVSCRKDEEEPWINNWLKTGGVFSRIKSCADTLLNICEVPRVTAGMIVYNGDDYIEYSVKSILNIVSEMIIVDGAIKKYDNGLVSPESNDNTLGLIKKLQKEDIMGKIVFVPAKEKAWEDEVVKRNEIAKRVTGQYYVLVDHDEIWKPDTLIDVIATMERNKNIAIMRMPFKHFWLSFKNVAEDDGGKWSTKHPRVWRWKKGFIHLKNFNFFNDPSNDWLKVGEPFVEEAIYDKDFVYHFGYCRSTFRLLQKIEYYRTRGIENCGIDTVTPWNKLGDTTQPTQKGVRSWASPFKGELPEILKQHPYFLIDDVRKVEKIIS